MDAFLEGLCGNRGNIPGSTFAALGEFTISVLVIGAKGEMAAFRETCLAGMKTIPAYIAFLAACYWTIDHVNFGMAVFIGIFAWMAVIVLIFLGGGLVTLTR